MYYVPEIRVARVGIHTDQPAGLQETRSFASGPNLKKHDVDSQCFLFPAFISSCWRQREGIVGNEEEKQKAWTVLGTCQARLHKPATKSFCAKYTSLFTHSITKTALDIVFPQIEYKTDQTAQMEDSQDHLRDPKKRVSLHAVPSNRTAIT